eukprot:3280830-Pleurochrysis_carterae.AAC.1
MDARFLRPYFTSFEKCGAEQDRLCLQQWNWMRGGAAAEEDAYENRLRKKQSKTSSDSPFNRRLLKNTSAGVGLTPHES